MKTAFQKKAYSILTALVLLLTACTGAVFSSSRAAALELEGPRKADNPYSQPPQNCWSLRKRQRLIPTFVQC